MSTIPESYPAAITWTTNKLANWPNDPTVIGLDDARILQLTALKDEAAAALANAQQLDEDKKAAYEAYHNKAKAMRDYASQSVGIIRSFARGSDNPSAVYTLAQIPAPADPTPAPAPGKPKDFEVLLLDGGSLEVTFECDNGREGGVTYEVRRRDSALPGSPFQFVMNALERKFTDDTIPNGTGAVTYRVQAIRSTGRGYAAERTIIFGAGNSAQIVSSGEEAA
ncbi:hypothetical protein AY599_00355 [Leptolyngbya valderiana BDU 20041]|nr:hypothetical protein AY599_00355 [Leptolyngbya valderiana BDU 20041]